MKNKLFSDRFKENKIESKKEPTPKKETPSKKGKNEPKSKKIVSNKLMVKILVDEFQQIKTYFRDGKRPSQKKAIENFENHLKLLI